MDYGSYRTTEQELGDLLSMIADHLDLAHCKAVDERYARALTWRTVPRPPLVVAPATDVKLQLPEPWRGFRRYRYGEAFNSPPKMLQNQLLERVVPGLLLGDDSPLAVRNNHGIGQIATLLGCRLRLHEDDFPWVRPLGSRRELERAVVSDVDLTTGILAQSFETLEYYQAKLREFPPCAEAIQISLPDLQGPMDTAELMWGSDIYLAFAGDTGFLNQLLSKIVDVMLVVAGRFRQYATDRLDPVANTQHGYAIPGRLLIRADSCIMLSPQTYAEHIRPHDARLLEAVGGGSVHFCGNGQHLVRPLLEIPSLKGIDPGQAFMLDIPAIYRLCQEHHVALTRVMPLREELISGTALRLYPTGAAFVYEAQSWDDAVEVARAYREAGS